MPCRGPRTGDSPVHRSPSKPRSRSHAIKDSFIIWRLILCLPLRRLPGNGSRGFSSSSTTPAPLQKQPVGLWSHKATSPSQQRTLTGAEGCMGRQGREGRGEKEKGSEILNLCSRRRASTGTGSDTTFECPDRGHTVVPLQLNYPAHNGEALRIDTSIESVSAALCGPTISISAEIDLLPREATIAGQSL